MENEIKNINELNKIKSDLDVVKEKKAKALSQIEKFEKIKKAAEERIQIAKKQLEDPNYFLRKQRHTKTCFLVGLTLIKSIDENFDLAKKNISIKKKTHSDAENNKAKYSVQLYLRDVDKKALEDFFKYSTFEGKTLKEYLRHMRSKSAAESKEAVQVQTITIPNIVKKTE